MGPARRRRLRLRERGFRADELDRRAGPGLDLPPDRRHRLARELREPYRKHDAVPREECRDEPLPSHRRDLSSHPLVVPTGDAAIEPGDQQPPSTLAAELHELSQAQRRLSPLDLARVAAETPEVLDLGAEDRIRQETFLQRSRLLGAHLGRVRLQLRAAGERRGDRVVERERRRRDHPLIGVRAPHPACQRDLTEDEPEHEGVRPRHHPMPPTVNFERHATLQTSATPGTARDAGVSSSAARRHEERKRG
jgi:hypothetical protein